MATLTLVKLPSDDWGEVWAGASGSRVRAFSRASISLTHCIHLISARAFQNSRALRKNWSIRVPRASIALMHLAAEALGRAPSRKLDCVGE